MPDPNLKPEYQILYTQGTRSDYLNRIINKLRFLMISCRKESRISLDQACKLIQVDKKKSAKFFAYGILRTLDETLGHPPIFRLPGESNFSFDEAWLASLIDSRAKGDESSIKFLLRSRVENLNKRSYMYFLIDGLVKDIHSL